MNWNAPKLVLGSIVVFVVVAACGSGERFFGDGGGGIGGADGSGSILDGFSGAIRDAVSNPVPDAKADGTQSGTRLKAQYLVGTDGSKAPFGWHDSQLNLDCTFFLLGDGTRRCVPYSPGVFANSWYSDQNCTQGLVYVTKGCAKPMHALAPVMGGGVCDEARYRVYGVGASYTPGMNLYQRVNGACMAFPAANVTGSYDLYTVAAELVPNTFVAMTVQTDP